MDSSPPNFPSPPDEPLPLDPMDRQVGAPDQQVPWGEPPDVSQPPRGRRMGRAGVAWVLIVLVVIGMMVMRQLAAGMMLEDRNADDPIGMTIMQMMSKYVMGTKYVLGGADASGAAYAQTRGDMARGSVKQRLAFVIFAGEMQGVETAEEELSILEFDIEDEIDAADEREAAQAIDSAVTGELVSLDSFELREDQIAVLEALDVLYREPSGAPINEPRVDALTDAQRTLLVDELGWFGQLALNPEGTDSPERKELESGARSLVYLLITIFVLGILGGVIGLVLLITMAVLAFTRRVRSRVDRRGGGLDPAGAWHHGVYAETFAIWLGVFVVLLVAAELAAMAFPQIGLLITAVIFFSSLTVLYWPVMRGIEWRTVRAEIGWTGGSSPVSESAVGVLAYLGGLPLLGIGLIGVLVFTSIQGLFAEPGPMFGGSGGAAHPIIADVANGDLFAILQIYLVASVAAPIVEETMFRGVLYRHLRDATGNWGLAMSVLFSTILNSFIFAIIHPQGWVAVPALMALAIAFTLAREWRGSLLPAMLMHGISNGLVMTLLLVCVRA